MAITVKSATDAASKWSAVAGSRGNEYKTGAMAAGGKWEQNAGQAGSNFQAAVTAGNIGARFASGVRKAGSAKYTRGIQNKGDRYSSGVQAGQQDYSTGVAPYLQAIASTDLPGRAPRGDPRNYQRVNAIGTRLHDLRLATLSANG